MLTSKTISAHQAGYALDLSELRVLYNPENLNMLIARAAAQLSAEQIAFDTDMAALAYVHAAHVLHRMKGTASFFGANTRVLDALDTAEKALRLGDSALIDASLPAARQALAYVGRVLGEQ